MGDVELVPDRPDPSMLRDWEAERTAVSAMLNSDAALQECVVSLLPEDFTSPALRAVFEALCNAFDAGDQRDPVSLCDALETSGKLGLAGGADGVRGLYSDMLAIATYKDAMGRLRGLTTRRRVVLAANQIMSLSTRHPEDMAEVVDAAESALLSCKVDRHDMDYEDLSDVVYEVAQDIFDGRDAVPRVMTGYDTLDEMTLGLEPGQLVVLGARPGVGKTALALNMAENMARAGVRVVYFTLEMTSDEVAQRIVSSECHIPLSRIRGGALTERELSSVAVAKERLSHMDILMDDDPELTVSALRTKARRMTQGHDRAVVVVDYLQLMSAPSAREDDTRATVVTGISRGLKLLAKELQVPVIALSQLNRKSTTRVGGRPLLSDLRESGSIEQDADVVLLLDRSLDDEEAQRDGRPAKGMADLIVAKNRSGAIGVVSLAYVEGQTRFVEGVPTDDAPQRLDGAA